MVVRRTTSSEEQPEGSVVVVKYGMCQKNHAANVGGHALDGCREFMASGDEGTTESLTCAACGCHRNFHKREVETTHEAAGSDDECCSSPTTTSNGT